MCPRFKVSPEKKGGKSLQHRLKVQSPSAVCCQRGSLHSKVSWSKTTFDVVIAGTGLPPDWPVQLAGHGFLAVASIVQ